jgi:putative endonuclease
MHRPVPPSAGRRRGTAAWGAEVVTVTATYAQRKAIGDYGERLAARLLEASGFVVLDRNWRCRQGELDIVACDGGVLVGCEVKTRRGARFGMPIEAITQDKADRLSRLLLAWATAHAHPCADGMRIDVVAVLLGRRAPTQVSHIRGLS